MSETKETRGRKKKVQPTNVVLPQPKKGRGRPKKVVVVEEFDPSTIKITKGEDLKFSDNIFVPMSTDTEMDVILSSKGGLMPATNIVLVGGPGSGKSTVALNMLSGLTKQGYDCLFVSGEMDEIQYFKYCKRLPKFSKVPALFLKNHPKTAKQTLEHVFNQGYDVVVVDSIAEVLEMVKDSAGISEAAAEFWFLNLQDKMKLGQNESNAYTTFINIQQVTKGGDFVGSNRLKHMTDAMCHIEVDKDSMNRSMYFSKNRDCDKDFKVYFSIFKDDVYFTFDKK